jgi:cytochrome c556
MDMAVQKTLLALCIAVGLASVGGSVSATEQKAKAPTSPGAKAAYTRQENFKQQGAVFKAIRDELKKDAPNLALISSRAVKLKSSADALPTWFPKGSGPESKYPTDAKPEVWSDPVKFASAVKRLQVEATKFQTIAASGDVGAMKAQSQAVGGTCKGCHDSFRVPEE